MCLFCPSKISGALAKWKTEFMLENLELVKTNLWKKWWNFINMCLLHNDSHKRTLLAQETNSLYWIYYIGAQTGHRNQGQDQAADPRS